MTKYLLNASPRAPLLAAPVRPAAEDPARFAAWVPVYTDTGSRTRIYYPNGRHEDSGLSVRSLLRHTAAYTGVDPALLRAGARRRLYCPLTLEDTVLLPLKLRLPRCPRDNTVGYVNLLYLAECAPAEGEAPSACTLEGGTVLPVYWSYRTLRRRVEEGLALLPRRDDPLYPLAMRLAELLRALIDYKQSPP